MFNCATYPNRNNMSSAPAAAAAADASENVEGDKPMSKAAMKKAKKMEELAAKKKDKEEAEKKKREDDKAVRLAEVKDLKLEEDKTLPAAVTIEIREAQTKKELLDKRVRLFGWVHFLRQQGEEGERAVIEKGGD